VSAAIGTFFGQLIFGRMTDQFGRKKFVLLSKKKFLVIFSIL
jgi:MFS family permease